MTVTATRRIPVAALFAISAVFHYLGPAFAVLLFAHVSPAGVAWLRIASAAVVFAVWRKPWRWSASPRMLALGAVLAAMNTVFYLAIARLPLATVGAIEFLGTVVLAAAGVRTGRNALALVLAVGGVAVLTDVRIVDSPWGFALAFLNCALFVLYVVLGHKVANTDGADGIDALGAAMVVAAVVATPFGVGPAAVTFTHPGWLAAGIAVGICSSVIPYVTDQLVMARIRRATFALMLSLLPAMATAIGLVVLGQVPTAVELAGIALVVAGVALHRSVGDEALKAIDPERGARPSTTAKEN